MRGVVGALALVVMLCAGGLPGRVVAQPAATPAGPTVWDDPDRFRALATRTEPWPLRDAPRPPGVNAMPGRGCAPGQGFPVVIGQARLRLPGFTYVVAAFPAQQTQTNALMQRLRAMDRDAYCFAPLPADWSTAPRLDVAFLDFGSAASSPNLDPRCHRAGLPGDPSPACDRPDNGLWWSIFVAGRPVDIHLQRTGPSSLPDDQPLYFRDVWNDPGRRLEPRPSGGWTLRDPEGRARAVVLPRLDQEHTREPLIPLCLIPGTAIGGGWHPPGPPEQEARRLRPWTLCEVGYRHRSVLWVRYRFQREVHDEPDIPGLDQRVRRLVQQMLDGAEDPAPARDSSQANGERGR